MARSISCPVRKTNLIGLTIPQRTGKIGFRFSFATNFDGSFTNLQVVPNHGFRSVSVPPLVFGDSPLRGLVGFVFRPSDYTTAIPAMIDGIPLFIRVEAQNPNGTFDSPEAMHLILPNRFVPGSSFMLKGTVPVGVSMAESVEIQLPGQVNDWQFKTTTGGPTLIAFEPGGPEYSLLIHDTIGSVLAQTYTTITQVFLRVATGSTTLDSIFTLKNSKSI